MIDTGGIRTIRKALKSHVPTLKVRKDKDKFEGWIVIRGSEWNGALTPGEAKALHDLGLLDNPYNPIPFFGKLTIPPHRLIYWLDWALGELGNLK